MSSPIQVLDNINTAAIKGGNDGGGIVGTVYNNATLKRNSNSAPTINGVTFVAGIVGNYQITGTPADPSLIINSITLESNTSTTDLENITVDTGNCKALIIFSNNEETTHIINP